MARRTRQITLTSLVMCAALSVLSLTPATSGAAVNDSSDPKSQVVAPYDNDTIGFHADQQIASAAIRDELAKLPTENGGLSSNGPDQLTVHLLTGQLVPSAAVEALMTTAESVGVTISVDQVGRSTSELNQLDTAACGSALFSNIRITKCAVDPDSNGVLIGVEQPTDELRQAVASQFGDAVQVIQHSEPVLSSGRLSDTPAFPAGDAWAYVDGSGVTTHCTTGFTMTDQFGSDYTMTAGHCFGAGVTGIIEHTASSVNGNASSVNSQQVGVEYYTQYSGTCSSGGSHNCYDGAIAKGQSYLARSWIGGPITSTLQNITSVVTVNSGTNVYFSGSATGQQLGKTSGPPLCFQDSDGNYQCGLQETDRIASSGRLCTYGDSGGPVYGPNGHGNLVAIGLIIACATDGSYAYYVNVPALLNGWNATIKTF
jgi:hypothetical protein